MHLGPNPFNFPPLTQPDRVTGPNKKDPADYSKQLLDNEDKLWEDLDVKTDIREMLQITAEFYRTVHCGIHY